jgi:RNA polymerase sigma-70 factor (ECF subfamily)
LAARDRTSLSDEELMREFCLGEPQAFDELYLRHAAKIYGFLKSRISDRRIVEDVFQETFFKLCTQRQKYNRQLPFLPWFFTICRNTMLDALRVEKRATRSLPESETEEPQPAFAIHAEGYAHYLESLSARERRIVELHFIQNLPFKSIAGELGLTSSAARQISSRAIQKLRRFFSK